MPSVVFTHPNPQVGRLVIDTGLDGAEWGYGLNTATFPTYGGEVVQILSVYIDDLTLMGTVSTYRQLEAIYSYFAAYLQVATQGKNPTPSTDVSSSSSSYNLFPVYFSYPERNWNFRVIPKALPGFRKGRDVVAPTWQLSAHVIDDSPDLDLIKDGIKALETQKLIDGSTLTLNGEISPRSGNPDTDPFQTFDQGQSQQAQAIQKYSDYYNSLIPSYSSGDFSALVGGVGSQPAFGQTSLGTNNQNAVTVQTPGTNNVNGNGAPVSVRPGTF